MRVAWVHPSWRDLLIEQLAADEAARRRFLAACGPTGALLALSAGGGRGGERRLPLLRTDADWDVLTERLHQLLPELAGDDLRELMLALTGARESTVGAERVEVLALTEQLLGWVGRRWHARPREVSVELLAAWLEAAEELRRAPEVPHLEAVLLELAPTSELDLGRAEDCERVDDWLWLVGVARRRRPEDLERIGYPARFMPDLRVVLDRTRSDPRAQDNAARLRGIEQRLAALGTPIAPLVAPEPVLVDPWPMREQRTSPHAPQLADELVTRILRDL